MKTKQIAIIAFGAAAVAALVYFGRKVYIGARGIINNNPGNIRRTSDEWEGLSKVQNDPDFFQFESAVYGIRAMAKLLRNYQRLYGLTTITGIISRWAPPSENDTASYIASVANSAGYAATQSLNMENTQTLLALIKGMIKVENGFNPYSDKTILDAISLITT